MTEPIADGFAPADAIDEMIPSFVGCEEHFVLDGEAYVNKDELTASLGGNSIAVSDATLAFEGEHLTSMELIFDLDGLEVIYLLTFIDFGSVASIA